MPNALLSSQLFRKVIMRSNSSTSTPSFTVESLRGQPTFSQQSKLPRLPIPDLENTARRYIRSLEPIATSEELQRANSLMDDFVKTVGPTLQRRLQDYDKKQKYSWLEDMWLDKAYLSYREPVMLNVNWYMVFKAGPAPLDDTLIVDTLPYTRGQLIRAAVLSKLACDFKVMLDKEQVPIDATKSGPLCMNQTTKMFGVTRIPRAEKDALVGSHPAKGKTAMVMLDEQIFVVKVVNQTAEQIYGHLVECVQQLSKLKKRSPPIGILTSEHRDPWAVQYKKIEKLNGDQLKKINDTLFTICLDSQIPQSAHEAAALALHGQHGKNRWFDKCVEFFVTPNAVAGCNGEHSPCDAVIPNQMTTFVLQQLRYLDVYLIEFCFREKNVKPIDLQAVAVKGKAEHVMFNIQLDTWEAINAAQRRAAMVTEGMQVTEYRFHDFGAEAVKKGTHHFIMCNNVQVQSSPDAFFQAALQMAFFKRHGRVAPVYETASTRQFLHGRTETIRVCCREARKMAELLSVPNTNDTEKAQSVRAFLKAHRQLLVDASNGQGVDRHLLGLRAMVDTIKGEQQHPLFSDPLFSRSVSFDLSTSNVSPGDLYDGLGFGPATNLGYGVNYSLSTNTIRYCVTCKRDPEDPQKAERFGNLVGDTLRHLHNLLNHHVESKL